MNNDIDKIETQYNEHPYPLPIDDMHERIAGGYIQGSCPEFFWQRIFPEKKFIEKLVKKRLILRRFSRKMPSEMISNAANNFVTSKAC